MLQIFFCIINISEIIISYVKIDGETVKGRLKRWEKT